IGKRTNGNRPLKVIFHKVCDHLIASPDSCQVKKRKRIMNRRLIGAPSRSRKKEIIHMIAPGGKQGY
ncbi:MAG: hypothetical protein AAGU11_11715, partial [Syntrophobacteraceae bacterium]